MKCEKIPFTKKEAINAVRTIAAKSTGLTPVRKYWCGQHKAYHITSKPRRGKKNSGRQR